MREIRLEEKQESDFEKKNNLNKIYKWIKSVEKTKDRFFFGTGRRYKARLSRKNIRKNEFMVEDNSLILSIHCLFILSEL